MPLSRHAPLTPWYREALRANVDKALLNPELTSKEKTELLSKNQHDRLYVLKRLQKHTLDYLFKKKPNFYTSVYHYDWWAFPMYVPKDWDWKTRNYNASITQIEAKKLWQDAQFRETYLQCVSMYIAALETHGWNDYPVRYARMLQSLSLFVKMVNQEHLGDDTVDLLCQQAQRALEYVTLNRLRVTLSNDSLFMHGYAKLELELRKHNSLKCDTVLRGGGSGL